MPDTVELSPALAAWYEAAKAASAEIAKYTEIKARAVEHIQAAMGDHEQATIGGQPAVSWKPSKPSEYIDAKALRDELPDVAARYTRLKAPARPFRLLGGDE